MSEQRGARHQQQRPRIIYFQNSDNSNVPRITSRHQYNVSSDEDDEVSKKIDSEDQRAQQQARLPHVEGEDNKDCKVQYEWQTKSFPTCNLLHEQDVLTDLVGGSSKSNSTDDDVKVRLLANGYWRDVWMIVVDQQKRFALKTLRLKRTHKENTHERHRRDAVAMERLTSSSSIVNIYGFCGTSAINEFAPAGNLEDLLWWRKKRDMTMQERLVAAWHVAQALADVHGGGPVPAIAHTDIMASQFVLIDGQFKLNDFNLCKFLAYNLTSTANETCGFYVDKNGGTFRSPEEYMYGLETEKIDIYSMGNVFYVLLTSKWPFDGESEERTQELVKQGKRPLIPAEIRESDDPIHRGFLKVIDMCWSQDPKARAAAKDVATYLKSQVEQMGPLPETSVLFSRQ